MKSKKLFLILLFILTTLFIISYFFNYNNVNNIYERFEAPLPSDSHYYLFNDDNKYFFFDNYKAIDYQTNPLIFNTYNEYINYHIKIFGNSFKPLKSRSNRKPLENREKLPILPYQWMCKRKYADAVAKYRDCINQIYNRYNENDCKKFLEENPKNDVFTNYNEEICMVNSFHTDYPDVLNKNKIKKVSFNSPLITNIY